MTTERIEDLERKNAQLQAERDEARESIEEPSEPGGFVGDIWFGHPVKRTMGTHRWTGDTWEELPSETVVLMEMLAEARSRAQSAEAQRDQLQARVGELEADLAHSQATLRDETNACLKFQVRTQALMTALEQFVGDLIVYNENNPPMVTSPMDAVNGPTMPIRFSPMTTIARGA